MAYIALSDIAEATSKEFADNLGRKARSFEVEWNTEPDFVDTEDLTFLPEEPELIAVDEPEEGITHWDLPEGAEVEKG
jgi:hypothetical protein